MQSRKFSVFPKMSDVTVDLSEEEQTLLYAAWWRYGAFGKKTKFDNPLMQALYSAFLEDIDNSVKASNKNAGGRPKTKDDEVSETEGFVNSETGGYETLETGGFTSSETPCSETQETPRSVGSETPSYINQTKPYQTNTNQDKKEINKENQLCTDVVSYLNEKAGTHYKDSTDSTRKHIRARIREGYTLNDFKAVIDNRIQAWKNDPNMSQYLRPPTLFGTKFESYLNADSVKEVAKSEFARFR